MNVGIEWDAGVIQTVGHGGGLHYLNGLSRTDPGGGEANAQECHKGGQERRRRYNFHDGEMDLFLLL